MKKIKILCIIFIFSIVTTSCFPNASQEKNNPLRIGLMPTMDSVAIATAYELGFFEEHHIEVELIPFSSARDRDAAFQTGNLDGATVDLIAVGLLNEGDFPIRATSVTTAHFTLIATPQYNDLPSLENGTVIISNNTAIDFVMDHMLDMYGLEHDHIVREEVPNIPARFEMVRNHQADAALISEPFATMATTEGLTVITDTIAIDFNPFVLAFSDDAIRYRAEELRNFYLAYNEAVDFLNSNPVEEHLDIIIDLIGFPEAVIDHIELPTFLKSELPSDEIVELAIQWLITRGLTVDTDLETFTYDLNN